MCEIWSLTKKVANKQFAALLICLHTDALQCHVPYTHIFTKHMLIIVSKRFSIFYDFYRMDSVRRIKRGTLLSCTIYTYIHKTNSNDIIWTLFRFICILFFTASTRIFKINRLTWLSCTIYTDHIQ